MGEPELTNLPRDWEIHLGRNLSALEGENLLLEAKMSANNCKIARIKGDLLIPLISIILEKIENAAE